MNNPPLNISDKVPDKVNVLLVDDQQAKLLSHEVVLAGLGETLLKANSARDALECLLKNEVAVILIDVCMPELDGFELAAMIREHPRFKHTAIIFVSAVMSANLDQLRGYQLGAVDYVPVPVVPELLRAKVKVFVDLYRKTRQLEKFNAELEARVLERTAELRRFNEELEQRIAERTRERETALAQLFEAQKMDTIGQLTGGVAHDFNNLLMAVLGSLTLLEKRLPNDAQARRLLSNALQGAERGAALTQRLLAFSRRQELKPEPIGIADLVRGMADLLQRSLGPTVSIETHFPERLAKVRADANQLELALLNLAVNARDAMPGGGVIGIAAREQSITTEVDGLQPGSYVCLSVTDQGEGMDEATRARAVEPFFTTKGIGKGTGLGLSMAHGLAAQSGGVLRIDSQPQVGTTVELWLPRASAEATVEIHSEPASAPIAFRHCKVLIVDDDALVLMGTAALVDDLGHTAIEAQSGAQALAKLAAASEEVDVVITDYAMPGMTGLQLAQSICERYPGLPVILATGYAELPSEPSISGVTKLSKPFVQRDLAMAIHTALSAGKVVDFSGKLRSAAAP